MAMMIPADVKEFTTEGERESYHFLWTVAKPDIDFTVWYSPDIQGKEPDFVLFHPKIGLIMFEVKDWALDQIIEADSKRFRLWVGTKQEDRTNPMLQAKNYVHDCLNALRKDGRLLSYEFGLKGKPKIPISHGVIFTNINKAEFEKEELDSVIEMEKVFFWDDLHLSSQVEKNEVGNSFENLLMEKFPPLFSFELTEIEKHHLNQILYPVVKIEQPRIKGETEFARFEKHITSLDHHQEAIARKFDGGHRILKGPSGCGKTLVLIYKAIFLLRYNRTVKSILFVCFNITLVRYIKRMLAKKNVPLGKKGVDVVHFYDLCSCIVDRKVDFEGQESEYYQLIIKDALEASGSYQEYDAVLIDEGQDFSDEMFKVVMNLLNPATNILTIALDENQNIYDRTRSWKDLGIQARGRTHSINFIYRSTRGLTEFASRFISKNNKDRKENGEVEQLELFPGFFDYHGPKALIGKYSKNDELLELLTVEINRLITEENCPPSEIAVLYTKSQRKGDVCQNFPPMVIQSIESRGIISDWVSEDVRTKQNFDVTTESVKISTIHSVKGFDFAAVFVVGLDWLDESRWTRKQTTFLTYVAITRARYRLYIPFENENQVIKKLLASL